VTSTPDAQEMPAIWPVPSAPEDHSPDTSMQETMLAYQVVTWVFSLICVSVGAGIVVGAALAVIIFGLTGRL